MASFLISDNIMSNVFLPLIILFLYDSKTINIVLPALGHHARPPGCNSEYKYKHLGEDILSTNSRKNTNIPVVPACCSESPSRMIPDYMKKVTPLDNISCPYKIRAFPFTLSKTVLVRIDYKDQMTMLQDVYLSAIKFPRNTSDLHGGRIGRFVASDDVSLICCDLKNKNVATMTRIENSHSYNFVFKAFYNFYWVPSEVDGDDHEGQLYFTATLIKNSKEYWIGVNSPIITITERDI